MNEALFEPMQAGQIALEMVGAMEVEQGMVRAKRSWLNVGNC